ncbi:hypothetical protein EJV47_21475 [Hymenobacter gummosus]|uniref:DUF4168 domain-containing protein n=1 Tax=Hymenobacter gummosus TaxID=1776032 RepID=A0A3S0QFD9_9BACT|nr:hypothetical protein [Hymenobacter gummosus]RTQ46526.1 hypothetical protein EJV47_21475 [Hymenobacter gummosus]
MKLSRRHLFALVLTALLLPGLHFTSFGANGPVLTPDAKAAADQGALSLTLYLTDALHLTQAQAVKVRECTRQELQLLAASPTSGTPDATLEVQKDYETAMAGILTPTQFTAFRALERGPIVTSTLSRVLAAR